MDKFSLITKNQDISGRINILQFGRGIAALMVVFYHVSLIFHQKLESEFYWDISHFGQLGVNFFFVLSGFIILMAHYKDIGRPKRILQYIKKRSIRIYPIYWICFFTYITAAALGIGEPDFKWEFSQLFSAFTLVHWVPQDGGMPLHVAWTLFYEMMFYAIFLAFIANRYAGIILCSLWLAGMVFGLDAYFESGTFGGKLFSWWGLHFLLGMGAFLICKNISNKTAPVFLLIGFAILAWFASSYNFEGYRAFKDLYYNSIVLLSFAFMFILSGLVMLERYYKLKIHAAFVFLGNASYSIYLAHSMVISLCVILIRKLGLTDYLDNYFGFWLTFFAAVISTCIFYYVIERPMLAYFRRNL